jgi:hypothetical protein
VRGDDPVLVCLAFDSNIVASCTLDIRSIAKDELLFGMSET